jgi:hypothetical protein
MTITITVETGAVIAGANSFISLADWKTWADSRGYDYSSYTDEQIKAALVKAADYLDGLSWKGFKTARANPMCWPRYGDETGGNFNNLILASGTYFVGVLDGDGYYVGIAEVPAEVIAGQSEATWETLGGTDLQPSLDRGGAIASEKVEGAVAVSYFPGASSTTRFIAIERRLSGLLLGSGTAKIVRA